MLRLRVNCLSLVSDLLNDKGAYSRPVGCDHCKTANSQGVLCLQRVIKDANTCRE